MKAREMFARLSGKVSEDPEDNSSTSKLKELNIEALFKGHSKHS